MTQAPPLVRHAVPEDIDGIVEVYLSNARHHAALDPVAYRVPDGEAVRTRFALGMAESEDEDLHLVAVVHGRIVGHAAAMLRGIPPPGSMRVPTRSAEIGIAVLDEWRGRGLGTMLIEAIEDWAVSVGLDALVLDVAAGNEGARRLYERLGYAPASQQLAKSLRTT